MSIVGKGYEYIPGKESNIGFFPLYPMLIKVFSAVFHNELLIGYIISNVALLLAAIYLYKLIELDFKDQRVAVKTVFYMMVCPMSFYFSIIYAEGIFLALSIASIYCARKKQWLAAGALGFFLALSRSLGVVIIIPLFFEYFDLDFGALRLDLKKIKGDILYLLLPPMGLLAFMFYAHVRFNNAFAYFHSQSAHPQRAMSSRGFVSIFTTLKTLKFYPPFWDITFIGAIILALLTICYLAFRRARMSYVAYAVILVFLYLSSGVLESIPRYISVVFPVYLGMALLAIRHDFFDRIFTIFSIMLLTLFTILYANGYWIV